MYLCIYTGLPNIGYSQIFPSRCFNPLDVACFSGNKMRQTQTVRTHTHITLHCIALQYNTIQDSTVHEYIYIYTPVCLYIYIYVSKYINFI